MSARKDHVILVNEKNEWLGTMEKMAAHELGLLHRAFSVFILNEHEEMLLQRRAQSKYHSGGLWSNACCSHPYPGESTAGAAQRRMQQELGITCSLTPLFQFRYRAVVGNGLIENEYDHVYVGEYSGSFQTDPEEVEELQFVALDKVQDWLRERPEDFTAWFRLALPRFLDSLKASRVAA